MAQQTVDLLDFTASPAGVVHTFSGTYGAHGLLVPAVLTTSVVALADDGGTVHRREQESIEVAGQTLTRLVDTSWDAASRRSVRWEQQSGGNYEIHTFADTAAPASRFQAFGPGVGFDESYAYSTSAGGSGSVTRSGSVRLVGVEEVATVLGTFSCLKVQTLFADTEAGTGRRISVTLNEWLARGFGRVKYEFAAIRSVDGTLSPSLREEFTIRAANHPVVFLPAVTVLPPVITRQPRSQDLFVDDSWALSVEVDGTPPFTYQWRHDEAVIGSGELIVSFSARLEHAGVYTVTVGNAAGETISEPAVIRVREPEPPLISGLPPEIRIAPGGTARLAPTIAGDGPFTYQWFHDGVAVGSPYFAHHAATLPGSYQLAVTGRGGSAMGPVVIVAVVEAPEIIAHPASVVISPGGRAVLRASAIGRAPFVYQWRRDGVEIPGATTASLAAADPGAYSLRISNAHGEATSSEALVTVAGSGSPARLVNLSARAWAGWNDARIIAGFVTKPASEGRAPILVRAVGPGLEAFSMTSRLTAPVLRLLSDGGAPVLETDDGWDGNDGVLLDAMRNLGAFDLEPGSRDCAVVVGLEPNGYTASVHGAGDGVGIALVEAYDAAADSRDRLANLSTRAWVGSGEMVLIAGLVLEGSASREILIRAVGPGLGAYAVSSPLANPEFTLYDGTGRKVTHNDDWDPEDAVLVDASERSGAFTLTEPREAATVLSLNPGAYTIVVEGVGTATGIALVEVYTVPGNLP